MWQQFSSFLITVLLSRKDATFFPQNRKCRIFKTTKYNRGEWQRKTNNACQWLLLWKACWGPSAGTTRPEDKHNFQMFQLSKSSQKQYKVCKYLQKCCYHIIVFFLTAVEKCYIFTFLETKRGFAYCLYKICPVFSWFSLTF